MGPAMMRSVACLAFALPLLVGAIGCSSKGSEAPPAEAPAADEPPPEPEPEPAPEPTADEVPVAEDFEDQASAEITADNYAEVLDELAKEIEAELE